MKIIKPGIIGTQVARTFTCHYCHCIFEAEPGEYTEATERLREYSNVLKYEPPYRSICPTCGHPVFYVEPRPL